MCGISFIFSGEREIKKASRVAAKRKLFIHFLVPIVNGISCKLDHIKIHGYLKWQSSFEVRVLKVKT